MLDLSDAERETMAAIQECIGLKDAEVKRMLKQVPGVKEYAFDAASMTALQAFNPGATDSS